MKTRFNKILTVITAVTFVAALTLNIQASLSDPFAGMSDGAVALTTTDDDTTGGGLPTECYDKYNAYATFFHKTLIKFRDCDLPGCTHIWAYYPRSKTLCQSAP
jgi:hypothetical protein